ncbi:hypothetical protein EDD21DRAFT_144879 [Dissophora ornata]|nr:hypothetical protein EDD21DRAFT_144879 [Dissophora ornata]
MTMVASEPSQAAPPLLPVSERDFMRSLMTLRYRERPEFLQSLALTHGDNVLPLLEELLATQPAVQSILISRPVQNGSELNADGGIASPVTDMHSLYFPQTNASSRYIQRDAGITMAVNLSNRGSKPAIALLLSNLNHPYRVGKKGLIQCLASCASDEDLLAASTDSAPSVLDALVAALTKAKRKAVVRDILGKPESAVELTPLVPVSTRFRRALEQANEFQRERIWKEYLNLLDVNNQPGKNVCEVGESIMDVVLTLQETLPPLHPWDNANPQRRSPKLAALIEDSLVPFLKHDTERTMRILQNTSWQVRGNNQYTAHIPTALHGSKRSRRFWCHGASEVTLLQEYWLSLIAVGDGELVKKGLLPHDSLFHSCHGPAVDRLVRAAMVLLAGDEFKTLSKTESESQVARLNNVLKFAVAGINNLVFRVAGCSTFEGRVGPMKAFHQTLRELLSLIYSDATAILRAHLKDDVAFVSHIYANVLKPLLQIPDTHTRIASLSAFPPLAEHLFEQIKDMFSTKTRKASPIISLVENLLLVLAPQDMSVYTIPDGKYERPFSAVPAWDNNAAFQTCAIDCLKRNDKAMIQLDRSWIRHFSDLAPNLTQHQRDEVVQLICNLPSFKTLINADKGNSVFPMLESLCTNIDLRHRIVFPLVSIDKKDNEVDLGEQISKWAAYADIRVPSVRTLLVKETTKPVFEDRLEWLSAVLKATRLSGEVKEWIITLKWLIPKIRNEIQPNLMALAPHLLPAGRLVPRQYLDNATLEEANELMTLYLAMDAQNAAAVTPVYGITQFIDSIASEALKRFANCPSHPFYHLGSEIPWRHNLTRFGDATALQYYNLRIFDPSYSDDASERDEESEIFRRQVLAKGKETLKTEGGPWGLYRIVEGEEETFAQGLVRAYHTRWLSVKTLADPNVEGDDVQAFRTAKKPLWQSLCLTIQEALGWRWKKSPMLVEYVNEVVELLSQAPTKVFGSDTVLDWDTDEFLRESVNYVQSVYRIYSDNDNDWLRENRDKLTWHQRFRDLRLGSTRYAEEVENRINDCVLQNSKCDHSRYEALIVALMSRSQSAVHLLVVREFVSGKRPDLLTDRQLSMTRGILGLFNQVDTPDAWDFIVREPSRLEPRQCDLLKERHLLGMTDSATPFNTRVQHAEAFIAIPTTTVEDVANALCTPSLPSRITEALLMFLPTLGEPASTLQILLAPVYTQSHLARTSIHAVENALKCVPWNQIPDFILPLFPPAEERQLKVTVQKEGVRLACRSMRLMMDPKISTLIEDLLAREDLHNDVLVVILQSLLGLLAGPEGREARYQGITEQIWKTLAKIACSEVHKKSGVALVLLSVNPATKLRTNAPTVSTAGMWRAVNENVTLNSLSRVVVPGGLINRYVEDVLVPMCAKPTGENEADKDLLEVRTLALQTLAQGESWVTAKSAPGLARNWRLQASEVPLEKDEDGLWCLFAIGIARCVGNEVEGALANGGDGSVAWWELVGLVQDQVDVFMDKTLSRSLRQKALTRITSMALARNFLLLNFEKARQAGAFVADALDLTRPLLSKGMESVAWKVALEREVAAFNPQKSMSQPQINAEALSVLLRIADYSNRYLSAAVDIVNWVGVALMSKVKNNSYTKHAIGWALIKPHDDLADWIHLDAVGLNILHSNNGTFKLNEIMTFVERLAKQENAYFYWTERTKISSIVISELHRLYQENTGDLSQFVPSVRLELAALMERAGAAGWINGADAFVVREIMGSQTATMCAAFPHAIGPLLHSYIISSVNVVSFNLQILETLHRVATFGSQATALGNEEAAHGDVPHPSYGIAPSTVLILETYMNGTLGELDLTQFMAPNNLPLELMYGHWFPYRSNTDPEKGVVSHGNKNPSTLKELDSHWKGEMDHYSGYLKPLEQAVQVASQRSIPPVVLQAYRDNAMGALTRLPKLVLMRPFVYLEFMRLALTAPGSTHSINVAAQQIAEAFRPIKNLTADEFTYAWAPPLGLALDLAEYLLHVVREDAATEGQREAQVIEQLTAVFLSSWMQQTVNTPAGPLLAEAEDLKALTERYQRLVEELCEEGSGGQSVALQLCDFISEKNDLASGENNEWASDVNNGWASDVNNEWTSG